MIALLYMILSTLKVSNPEAYDRIESKYGLRSRATKREGRSTGHKRAGKRRGNPRALIKAIRANGRMSPAAKRKAIAKLRKRL